MFRPKNNSHRRNYIVYMAHIWTFVLLLFVGAVKNDTATLAQSEFWSDITRTYILSLIKDYIYILYIILFILFLYSVSSLKMIRFRINSYVLLFVSVYFYGFLRGMYTDFTFSAKMLTGFLLFLGLYTYIYSIYITFKMDASEIISRSFYLISVILISLNIIEYIAGGGFVPGVSRYFGSSSHPNFIGVQMAVCCAAVIYSSKATSKFTKFINFSFFLMGLFILYISGSRTALVVLLGETLCIILFGRRQTYTSIIAIHIFIVAVSILVLFYSDSILYLLSSSVYDRGAYGGDTRAEAWSGLWNAVMENPITGLGEFPDFSENSLLRGWAAMGIIYPICLAVILIAVTASVFNNNDRSTALRLRLNVSIFTGLTVGAIFEGYLVDTLSFPVIVWFVCLTDIFIVTCEIAKAKTSESR